jgi:calcium-dependent protein kinase
VDAANIVKQVLSAVNYCHSKNIVHRDLKPENLLLDSKCSNPVIKVIDFGTSQFFDPSQKLKQKYGTPYYIAPEVLNKNYNEKCDVWSMGVILYILLCGHPPFAGNSDLEILQKVQKGQYRMTGKEWGKVSAEGRDLVQRMLTYEAKKRISSSEALLHKWIQTKCNGRVDKAEAREVLLNLSNFRSEQKLQQAALTFIVSQLTSKEEKGRLQRTFHHMDKNGDGKLSREELIEGSNKRR